MTKKKTQRSLGFGKKAFQKPDDVFFPGFFWMWNTKLVRETLFAQMDDMVAHGSRAVCIHPYPNAFRPNPRIIKAGLGMSPDYLTDEYLDILSDVIDYAEKIGMVPWLYDEGGWPSGSACGQVYAENPEAFAQRYVAHGEDGQPIVKKQEYDASRSAPYPSITEKGVTETFIRLTHEKFRKRFSRHFGKTLKFTFMDEPDPPYSWPGERLGWTTDFQQEFLSRKGYDITPYLKALLDAPEDCDDDLKRVRIDYEDVCSMLFNERFMIPIRKWCKANGLLSGGHMNGDDNPRYNGISGYAHILRGLRNLDVPGVDVIWRQLYPGKGIDRETQMASAQIIRNGVPDCPNNGPFPKYASSAMHQNGGKYAMAEAFAIYADSLTPDEMKWLLDYNLVRGINLFVFSSYSADNSGARMAGGGPHFGYADPYWPFMKPLFTYAARIGSMLAKGKPVIKTAMLYDIRSIWAGGRDADNALKRHQKMADRLLKNCSDFDFVDDNQIADAAICKDGTLKIGKMRYSAVALPASRWMLASARRKLKRFVARGGLVLKYNELDSAPKTCDVTGSDCIRACRRVCGVSSLYFLCNESRKTAKVHIRLETQSNVVLCDHDTGRFMEMPAVNGEFDYEFPPCGSALFLCDAKADEPFRMRPDGKKLLLKEWLLRPLRRYAIGEKDFEFTDYADVEAKKVALGDWRKELGEEYSGTAVYSTVFDVAESCEAELDLGRVCHCAKVRLNGRALPLKFFGPFRYRVKLRKGKNTLEVTVANALANATSPKYLRDKVYQRFPPRSSYERTAEVFNKSNHESGLYGPVIVTLIH